MYHQAKIASVGRCSRELVTWSQLQIPPQDLFLVCFSYSPKTTFWNMDVPETTRRYYTEKYVKEFSKGISTKILKNEISSMSPQQPKHSTPHIATITSASIAEPT